MLGLHSLILGRCDAGNGERPGAYEFDVLQVVEIDADELMTAVVMFDLDDIDAAFAELDARYLPGEAAGHARTWTAITRAYMAINHRELPPTTPDWVNIDNRMGPTFAPGDMAAYLRAAWELAQDGAVHIEAVHRLNNVGAVMSHLVRGTSTEGFDAEWREIIFLTFDGDRVSRCEMFDEADLAAALARFDVLLVDDD